MLPERCTLKKQGPRTSRHPVKRDRLSLSDQKTLLGQEEELSVRGV